MYDEDGRRRERPGRGCLIALAVVVVIIIGIVLFVWFGVPKIMANLIINGEGIGIIPDELTESMKSNSDEFRKALAEYNLDTESMKDIVDSISAKELISMAEKIDDGTLSSADEAFEEFIKNVDLGSADIEKLRKEVSNADFSEIKSASADILENRKVIPLAMGMIKNTFKEILNEIAEEKDTE
jgi:hypothetical protein